MVSPRSAQSRIHIFHFIFPFGSPSSSSKFSSTIIACTKASKKKNSCCCCCCVLLLDQWSRALISSLHGHNTLLFFCVERRVIASRLSSGGMRRAGQHVDTGEDSGHHLSLVSLDLSAIGKSNNRKWNCINIYCVYLRDDWTVPSIGWPCINRGIGWALLIFPCSAYSPQMSFDEEGGNRQIQSSVPFNRGPNHLEMSLYWSGHALNYFEFWNSAVSSLLRREARPIVVPVARHQGSLMLSL